MDLGVLLDERSHPEGHDRGGLLLVGAGRRQVVVRARTRLAHVGCDSGTELDGLYGATHRCGSFFLVL